MKALFWTTCVSLLSAVQALPTPSSFQIDFATDPGSFKTSSDYVSLVLSKKSGAIKDGRVRSSTSYSSTIRVCANINVPSSTKNSAGIEASMFISTNPSSSLASYKFKLQSPGYWTAENGQQVKGGQTCIQSTQAPGPVYVYFAVWTSNAASLVDDYVEISFSGIKIEGTGSPTSSNNNQQPPISSGSGSIGVPSIPAAGQGTQTGGSKVSRPSYCKDASYNDPFQGLSYNDPGTAGEYSTGNIPGNKQIILKAMQDNGVPQSWQYLMMASAMMETGELAGYDSLKDNAGLARNFGPFNLNIDMQQRLAAGDSSLKSDTFGVRVFKAALQQYGTECTLNFIRGGGSLFDSPSEQVKATMKSQQFMDAIHAIYNRIKADPSLMTDGRRLHYHVEYV